jgi:KDO2-lipid IV(A) lauroyltransferase
MKDKLEFYFVKIFIWIIGLFPNAIIYKILKFVAKLLFKFEKRRSSLTLVNLQTAYPHKTHEEIKILALKSYESVATTLAEIILMLNNKINLDDMVENKEDFLEKLEIYTRDIPRGAVIITAHFSNWELAAQFLPRHGYPMVAIGREGNNKLIEKKITTPFRQRYGNKNVYKKNALLGIIKTIKKGGYVGLLFDQKAGGKNSVKVNFFNLSCDTTNSIAEMKLKFNPKIIPIFFPRNKNGKYTPIVYPPVEYIADEEQDKKEKIKKITQKYNDTLEEVIRKYPEQWFWMHNRWRLV